MQVLPMPSNLVLALQRGLTSDGAEFYDRCRRILFDLDEAEALVTQAVSIPHGRLRVHMPMGFGKLVVLPALTQMDERYPDLILDVELGEHPADPIDDGMDAVIHLGNVPNSSYFARKLCDVKFVVCASPAYLDKNGVPLTPGDLDQHTCTTWTPSKCGIAIADIATGMYALNGILMGLYRRARRRGHGVRGLAVRRATRTSAITRTEPLPQRRD
jgi:DNA-binding transcriptional LysR family regulator